MLDSESSAAFDVFFLMVWRLTLIRVTLVLIQKNAPHISFFAKSIKFQLESLEPKRPAVYLTIFAAVIITYCGFRIYAGVDLFY